MSWFKKFVDYLVEPSLPPYLLQMTAHRLSGFRVKDGQKGDKRFFITSLEPGLLEPSAEKNNIRVPEKLMAYVQQGLRKIGGLRGELSLLLPESCFRVFILTTENLPSSRPEQLALLRWRIKKLFPLLPEDFRFDFQAWRTSSGFKVLLIGAKETVIKEYEDLLARIGWQVRLIGVPTIYLLTLIKEKDFLVANIEQDYLALLVGLNGIPWLYRVKSFFMEKENDLSQSCLAEIENTLHFIEDKEKKQIKTVYLRWAGNEEEEPNLVNLLQQFDLTIKNFEIKELPNLSQEEQKILAPLLGQWANLRK